MEQGIRPCPIPQCGSVDVVIRRSLCGDAWVVCDGCGSTGPVVEYSQVLCNARVRQLAVERWAAVGDLIAANNRIDIEQGWVQQARQLLMGPELRDASEEMRKLLLLTVAAGVQGMTLDDVADALGVTPELKNQILGEQEGELQ